MSNSHSDFIVPLIRSLRGEIMAKYGQIDHDLKLNNTAVTEIDKKVEKVLIEKLEKEFPEIGFLGEEHGQKGPKDKYWVIDPIDGTEVYIRGMPGVTSMIALVENGEATQSYIYDPVDDIMYSAFKGGGAYADDKKIEASDSPIERSMIAIGSILPYKHGKLLNELKKHGVFYLGTFFGAGCKAIYVATGKIDGVIYLEQGGGPWDHIPSRLLMEEAGAISTVYDNKNISDSRSYSCLGINIYDEVSELIFKYLANSDKIA